MVFEWYFNGPRGYNGQWYLNGTSMVLGGIMANGI